MRVLYSQERSGPEMWKETASIAKIQLEVLDILRSDTRVSRPMKERLSSKLLPLGQVLALAQ